MYTTLAITFYTTLVINITGRSETGLQYFGSVFFPVLNVGRTFALVTATGFEPTTSYFVKKHSTI